MLWVFASLYLRYTFGCLANIHVQVYQIHIPAHVLRPVYQVSIHVDLHMFIVYKYISFTCYSCELYMHTRYTCILATPHISGHTYELYMLICIAIWAIHAHMYCHIAHMYCLTCELYLTYHAIHVSYTCICATHVC